MEEDIKFERRLIAQAASYLINKGNAFVSTEILLALLLVADTEHNVKCGYSFLFQHTESKNQIYYKSKFYILIGLLKKEIECDIWNEWISTTIVNGERQHKSLKEQNRDYYVDLANSDIKLLDFVWNKFQEERKN